MESFFGGRASASSGAANEGGFAQAGWMANPMLSRLGIVFLGAVGLACCHALLWHLRIIFVPFIFSGFIVLALQPSVDFIYRHLSGRCAPYRWFICGPQRFQEAEEGEEKLIGDDCDDETAHLIAASRDEPTEARRMAEHFGDSFSRFLAVAVVLCMVIALAVLIFLMLCQGAIHMKDNWESYKLGYHRMKRWQESIIEEITTQLPQKQQALVDKSVKEFYEQLMTASQDGIWEALNTIMSSVSDGLSFIAMLLLYVIFWLCAPLPTGGNAGALVRSYIYKKTLVSALYGLCVAMLFLTLQIDLAVLFGMVSFFLNYLPEVGAFISMLGPIPVIILDGRIEHPMLTLVEALVGQMILKVVFSNVLEVKLIETDREMSVHPVWVILGLSYFGFIWGPVGMLISVPMLAMLKTALASVASSAHPDDQVTHGFVETFLACLEGRKAAQDIKSKK
eukprot:TRINITY_DN95720_c0_g1_i1.p1 TRINITY_DN95720_c0_g1~~TRINITY_DN95720_c0_g1_i1.p1  ORF type:complete len:471 (+),score=121.88 TRINITY_DN95720_c0_g1_i1:63-1415(+)